jgi:hypothetical protein
LTNAPRWQELHDAWWSEQREPRPGDLEAAWDALWAVVPAGWTVARPRQDRLTGSWTVSAVLVSGTSRMGKMLKVVSAQGPSEPTVLVELARCLVVYERGGVPR